MEVGGIDSVVPAALAAVAGVVVPPQGTSPFAIGYNFGGRIGVIKLVELDIGDWQLRIFICALPWVLCISTCEPVCLDQLLFVIAALRRELLEHVPIPLLRRLIFTTWSVD